MVIFVTDRPNLDKNLSSVVFRDFYYLKEELVDFLRENGLPTMGGKVELADRVAYFLDTGEVKPVELQRVKAASISDLSVDTIIEDGIVCSEKHRAFFKGNIGESFSFNVAFQKWLKANAGKTYSEAIEAYYQILDEKKKSKTTIDSQFEYNTYIRDFFADNQGKSLSDAIKCWKYKKQSRGHNRYERVDLIAIE